VVVILQPGGVVRALRSYRLDGDRLFAAKRIVHESISGGAMGFLIYVFAIPALGLAVVAWAVATRRLADKTARNHGRNHSGVCGGMALIRTGGFTGSFQNDLHWRWTKTPEEKLVAQAGSEPAAPPPPR